MKEHELSQFPGEKKGAKSAHNTLTKAFHGFISYKLRLAIYSLRYTVYI